MTLKARVLIIGGISLYVWALIAWDYFHGGVPVHHFLASGDMPGFSNWWGGLLIPLVTVFVTYRLQQRLGNENISGEIPKSVIYTFLGALAYGAVLSINFVLGVESVPFYMLVALVALSLFFPIYRAEFFLGLVVGMIYTFGGVLPVVIVSILSLIGLLSYNLIRPAVKWGVWLIRGQ